MNYLPNSNTDTWRIELNSYEFSIDVIEEKTNEDELRNGIDYVKADIHIDVLSRKAEKTSWVLEYLK